MVETLVPDSVSAVNNATNASEVDARKDGRIMEIVMDNIDEEVF